MSLSQYFGHNIHPLPPVIEPGRLGSIHRYSHEQRIVKPLKHAPVSLTLAQQATAKQDKNRIEILRLLRVGICHAVQIAGIAQISVGTVWNHLKPMEADELIIINRAVKPWPITLTRKGWK